MTKNKKTALILAIVGILFITTAANMYYNFDFFSNLFDPTNPIDAQGKMIVKYMAMGDALVGLVLLGFCFYFVKKDDGIK
jgi:hypothetical protein